MFTADILAAIKDDAARRYPEESCGLVRLDGYEPIANVHETPREAFQMPDDVMFKIMDPSVIAVVHSHPDGPDEPSYADQKDQIRLSEAVGRPIAYGLCTVMNGEPEEPWFWGDGAIPEMPIMPRDFRWGPVGTDGKGDCFALMKDWYKQNMGLLIPDHPRDSMWQSAVPTRYIDNWQRHGFRQVDPAEVRVGDALLFAVRSRGIPNHVGIVLPHGYMIHQTEIRLARREPIGDWLRCLNMACRPPEPQT